MIILTGGAGFIGSCLLWRLNKEGVSDIIVVDVLDDPLKEKNLAGKKYAEFIDKDDFIAAIGQSRSVKKADAVFHLGACSSTTVTDRDFIMKNNYEYSVKLAKWAVANGARFIYASSGATYGDGSCGYSDEDACTRRLRPLNLYGESKQLFDLWVLDNRLADKVVGLKYFNVFGPNEYHKGDMRSVIAKSFEQIKREKRIRLFRSHRPDYKDGEQKRDFIYVKDAIDVTMHFFDNRGIGGIFNVGAGKAHSWNELAAAIFTALGMETRIEYFDMPVEIRDKYQYFTEAGLKKLRKAGYTKEFTPLETAVKEYVGYLETQLHL